MEDQGAPGAAETDAPVRTTFIERLAEIMSRGASSAAVYGAPVERDGVTVIPVAKIRYGFGGGSGHRRPGEEGSGGGGGVYARPVGYIEVKNGSSQYRRIRDPASMVPIITVSGLVGIPALRTLARLFR